MMLYGEEKNGRFNGNAQIDNDERLAFYPFAMMLTNNINLQRKPMPQQENTRMEKVMRGDTRMTNLLRRVELLSLFFFPFFFCLPSRIQ